MLADKGEAEEVQEEGEEELRDQHPHLEGHMLHLQDSEQILDMELQADLKEPLEDMPEMLEILI